MSMNQNTETKKSTKQLEELKRQLAPNRPENIEFRKRHGINLRDYKIYAAQHIAQYA